MNQYKHINAFIYDCKTCPTRCDGKSKNNYNFEKDLTFSEKYENRLMKWYNMKTALFCKHSTTAGYPDLVVFDAQDEVKFYIEVKIQARTFMSVKRILPQANLEASETIVLNWSDLARYFEIERLTKKKIYIVWGLLQRPCIVPENKLHYYHQELGVLKNIYEKYQDKRRFRRKSGKGDIVNGVHKGVVVNYHFSLRELKKGLPEIETP